MFFKPEKLFRFRVFRGNVNFDVANRDLDAGRSTSLMETMLFAYTLKSVKREEFFVK